MKFSEYYDLNITQPYLDFVDIPLDTDLAVFLEPVAIRSLQTRWGSELISYIQNFFEHVLKQIKQGDHDEAKILLASLRESNEFHLGYSKGKSKGHGFGDISAESIWEALVQSKATQTGLLQDLEDTALFIHGVGTDMISDALCNILRAPFIKYTQDMCRYHSIEMKSGVVSGNMWNLERNRWESSLVNLPVTEYGTVILIPKVLVRFRLAYNYDRYYKHYILPDMQMDHILKRSSLVEVLKNGKERVTKKALMEKYGKDKLAVTEQSVGREHILEAYKESIAKDLPEAIPHSAMAEIEGDEAPDFSELIYDLNNLKTGKETALEYEELIEKIMSAIFYPSLCYPNKQTRIHEGRKIIDITYINEAKKGFFYWLSLHHPSSHIFIECKNYGSEVGNPEIDQLAGRFSVSRGKVGFLVCRNVRDKKRLKQRCKDTANDGRGFIIPIDDADLVKIIEDYQENPRQQEHKVLREKFLELIN